MLLTEITMIDYFLACFWRKSFLALHAFGSPFDSFLDLFWHVSGRFSKKLCQTKPLPNAPSGIWTPIHFQTQRSRLMRWPLDPEPIWTDGWRSDLLLHNLQTPLGRNCRGLNHSKNALMPAKNRQSPAKNHQSPAKNPQRPAKNP